MEPAVSTWRDEAYVLDMLIWARRALRFVADLDERDFLTDELVLSATIRALEVVGEAARSVSDEYRMTHSAIPWSAIIGMRNRLAHAYHNVDPREVWRAATHDCPALVSLLEPLVPPDPPATPDEWEFL